MKPYCKYKDSVKNKSSFMYLVIEFKMVAARVPSKRLKFAGNKKAQRRELKPDVEEAIDLYEFNKFLKDYEKH